MLPPRIPNQRIQRFLGVIVHTEPQHSYSSRHETDHLRLIELPAPVMSALLREPKIKR